MTSNHESIEEAEVVIVGAGPAGTAAAITLSRLGHEVVLIDQYRFPRDKACGDGLWSGAVESLLELGLPSLIENARPIEKTRVIRTHDARPLERSTKKCGRRHLPRCIPRRQLDAALLEVAISEGARFLPARAQEIVESNGNVTAIVVRCEDGSRGVVRGRAFVAADGATSRLRRQADVTPPRIAAPAYAIRQYVRTELPQEPVFEIMIPVRYDERSLPGFSWIFPVDEHVANVGVGYFGPLGTGALENSKTKNISLRDVLRSVVDDLRADRGMAFGETVEPSKPVGAPLGIGFSADAVQKGNLFFVGDAARLADPLIGEGISPALESGCLSGGAVDGWLRRRCEFKLGTALSQRFPRASHDTRFMRHTADFLVIDAAPTHSDKSLPHEGNSFLANIGAVFMRGSDDKPTLDKVPLVHYIASDNAALLDAFAKLNQMALEAFHVEFPFAFDLLHRQFRNGAGPSVATSLLLTALSTGDPDDDVAYRVAIACEMVLVATRFLEGVRNLDEPTRPCLSNGLATFIGDFALSGALKTAVRFAPSDTAALTGLSRTIFEGAMSEAVDVWRTDRAAERYFAAAHKQSGEPHAFAVGLGARLAKHTGDQGHLDEFGRNLGVALKISNDAVELFEGDEPMAREPGDQLRAGNFTLATIFALKKDPALAKLLIPEKIDDALDEALACIRATGAVTRSFAECIRFAEAARAALERAGLRGTPLESLIDLAVERHKSCLVDESGDFAAAS